VRARAAILLGLAVLGEMVEPGIARAQGGTAQAQFDFGLGEMEGGRYASGCPALAESYRLDPRPGVLFTLAECENRWGKIASALTHYEAYIDVFARMRDDEKAHQRGRDRVALAQRDGLRGQVPELAIGLPPSAPAGTTVSRDGLPLGAPSLGVAFTVDPGEHVVVARTPDGASHETRVTVARAEHRTLVVDLTTPPPPHSPARSPSLAPTPSPTPTPPPTSSTRTWALVTGGIGLAGLAVGAIGGAIVLNDKSTIDASCNPDRTCSPAGLSAASHASTFGLMSDVGFAVGGVGLATSIVLYLVSPSRAVQPIASAGPHGGFVGLRAAW
jgi:hypothetical protein